MSLYPLQLPDLAEPPAADREDITVPNTLTADVPLQTPEDVPPVALKEGDRILTHTDGSPVDWRVTGKRRDEDGLDVVDYRTPDGDTDSFTVTDPGTRFSVEVRL